MPETNLERVIVDCSAVRVEKGISGYETSVHKGVEIGNFYA